MRKLIIISSCFLVFSCGDSITKKEYKSPELEYGEMFDLVQKQRIFSDSKTFADAVPKVSAEKIIKLYEQNKRKKGFDLKSFVLENFRIPNYEYTLQNKSNLDFQAYLEKTLISLLRTPSDDGGTLIPTRKKYISGGTKFEEFNYWRTYFAVLGLKSIGKDSIASELAVNCAQFIQDFGHVPAGNRSYMLSGSQLPVFSMMVKKFNNPEMLASYASALTKEYQYWMAAETNDDVKKQQEAITSMKKAYKKVVFLKENNLLNRYFDDQNSPRANFYLEDLKRGNYVESRTEAESGWESSSRWLVENKPSIISILPIDLNATLYFLEKTLSEAYQLKGKKEYAKSFAELAEKRKVIFDKYFWNKEKGYYFDYNFGKNTPSEIYSLAGVYPLFFGLASQKQADLVAEKLESLFLRPGGLMNSLSMSGAVVDNPYGTSQMQYMAIEGLKKYNKIHLAEKIKTRWILTNTRYFQATGSLLEGYNVVDLEKNFSQEMKNKKERLDASIGVLLAIQKP